MIKKLSWEDIKQEITKLPKGTYYGVPRGGAIVAALTGNAVSTPEEADYILDDLIDSGRTKQKYAKEYPTKPFIALYTKETNDWYEFPWEQEGEKDIEDSVVRILQYIGENPNREGLKDTPKRYIKFLKEFLAEPEWNFTTFSSEGYDEMIIQTNIPYYSLCEHHLAPFFGHGHIAYIPNGKIVGLSKLARTLDKFAHRLQNQERITQEVANYLMDKLDAKGVAVVLTAQHLCMEMREVKKHDTHTTTSKMLGVFQNDDHAKQEFLNLLKK